ncbi:MAG: Uma2 family endonuclease [Phaeodactylibacter sp.]|nr:Uma2 family endonuclease [Phaeodactylibacter sp.]
MASSAEPKEKIHDPIKDIAELGPLILDRALSIKEFAALSARYPDLRMEREKTGKITIMSPVKFGSGNRESIANFFLVRWWYQDKIGETFSASTGIALPDGAVKSPDCGWISPERLASVSREEREEAFLRAVPDFIIEVRSQTDRLAKLKKKMKNTWIKNGVRLAWLIDPTQQKTYIFRADGSEEVIDGFDKKISGEDVLPGFIFDLSLLVDEDDG